MRVLDRLMYGDAVLKDFRDNPRFSLIEGDVTDIAKLTAAMKSCSAVVHLAGLVGDPACAVNPEFTRHTNIIATRMARGTFVFLSTEGVTICIMPARVPKAGLPVWPRAKI